MMAPTTMALSDALAEMSEGAIALVSAPAFHCVAMVKGGQIHGPGGAIETHSVFEVRAFDGDSEWRWLRSGDVGRMAVVSDRVMERARLGRMRQEIRYVLWNQAADPVIDSSATDGWTLMTSEQIPAFAVPLSNDGKGAYATITAVEYTATDEYGNVRVVDQRLVSLEWSEHTFQEQSSELNEQPIAETEADTEADPDADNQGDGTHEQTDEGDTPEAPGETEETNG